MTISSIKRLTVKAKAIVKFPARVFADNFLTVTQANGNYTFGVDYGKLSAGPISDASQAFVVVQDRTDGTYKPLSVAGFIPLVVGPDLTAIEALSGTGGLFRTGANTWAISENWTRNKIGLAYGGTNADLSATGGTSQILTQPSAGGPVVVTSISFGYISGTVSPSQLPIIPNTLGGFGVSIAASSGVPIFTTGTAAFTATTGTGNVVRTNSPNITTPTGIIKGDVGLGNVANVDTTTQANVNFVGLTAAAAVADADTFPTNQGAANLKQTFVAVKVWIKSWITKSDVGLGNVDNTSDANKPVSTAQQTALNLKADLAGPTFTGIPRAPTAAPSNNSTQLATTAYVDAQVSAGVSGVSSIDGQTGALKNAKPPQGRLTLQSGVPVMTTSQTAKTTIYYTPDVGDQCPLYDGTNLIQTTFTELSVATTDTTKNPSAIGASKVNDWFLWNDSGTLRISHATDWTDDLNRSAGTALVRVRGIWLNAVSITNGPAAQRGTYLGTTRSDASSQFNWKLGGAASGGSNAALHVWNAYNRRRISTSTIDTAPQSYTGTTIRQWAGGTGMQVAFVLGLQEEGLQWSTRNEFALANSSAVSIGIGYNTTTAYSMARLRQPNPTTGIYAIGNCNAGAWINPFGANILSLNQAGDGGANEFNNTQSADLTASLMM